MNVNFETKDKRQQKSKNRDIKEDLKSKKRAWGSQTSWKRHAKRT